MLPADSNPFALPRDTMADRLAKLEKAYRRYPDSPLFARLADLYLDRGKTEEALEVCRRGCQHFPDYATGFLVLSKCYEMQGEVEQARDALDQSLRIDPVNPGGYRRLSGIYQKLGEPTLALKTLEQAALLDPFAEDIGEQVDQLIYQVRLESTRQTTESEIDPVVESREDPIGQMLVESPAEIEEAEEAEPFAQMQALPEWDDEPSMGEILAEFKQEPNPLFAEEQEDDDPVEKQVVEKGGPPEIGDIAALLGLGDIADEEVDGEEPLEQDAAVAGDAGNSDSMEDVVAGLGLEVMGVNLDTADASAENDVIEEIDFSSPFDPALMEQKVEDVEDIAAVDIPSADEWVRYTAQEVETEEQEVSIFSPDILPEDSDVFQPVEPVEATAVEEDVEPVEVAAVEEASFDQDAFNDILSALRGDGPETLREPAENIEAVEVVPDPTEDASGGDVAEDDRIGRGIEIEEQVVGEDVRPPDQKVAENAPEEGSQRPAIDLGPLIEAMISMGKTSSAMVPKTNLDETVEDETVEPAEEKVGNIADIDEFAAVEPLAGFDLADLQPPAPDAADSLDEFAAVEPLEEATLGVSDTVLPSLEDPVVDAGDAGDAGEDISSLPDESVVGRDGGLGGLNRRGDDELLRIFQEIETEGHAGGEVEEEVEKEPEVEQQKRIATATLAEIYTIQGLMQKAIETYRELLEQEPDNAFIRRKLEDLEKGSSRK